MFKALSSWFGIPLCILGSFCATSNPALAEARLALEKETLSEGVHHKGVSFSTPILVAQVTSDNTVNTQVTENGNTAEITGGETRGDNLFHSFQDFSVETGNEAFFNNTDSISNIFSRVTGGNVSDIDGAIRANGSASLFLINPAGIIFGENASLNIGGSFYGSSASSILFEDGEFGAADLDNSPLLTVNAPIGLGFRDEPGDIVNRSRVQNSSGEGVGLEVLSGNNLAFIGGNLNFEAGEVTASGGNITLGGLSEGGIVSINEEGSFRFPDDVAKADISLSNGADVDARGTGGSNVTVNARNLSLKAGKFGSSFIRAGVLPESTSAEAQTGDVTVDVAENITLDDSRILNLVDSKGVGNSGNITITTGSLEGINGGIVDASTEGQGDAGVVKITAIGNLTFEGKASDGFGITSSGVYSTVASGGRGNAGGITISTTNLNLTNGGQVDASTSQNGDAGNVKITATGDITLDGATKDITFDGGETLSTGTPSSIIALVSSEAVGNAGGITISTTNLNLTNGGEVSTATLNYGNAGAIKITATGDINIDGEENSEDGFPLPSGLTSLADTFGTVGVDLIGNAGEITISTNNLTLTNGGQVDASTQNDGDAGNVTIDASGNITIDGETSKGSPSSITTLVDTEGAGGAGNVTISTTNLNLTNGGQVGTSTLGQGNAGNVTIDASESIFISDSTKSSRSGISADALIKNGNGGDINVSTNQLSIENGGTIEATNFDSSGEFTPGTGQPGNIFIEANNLDLVNTARIDAATQSPTGESGEIDLQVAENITLQGNSFISARAFKNADGGNLTIDSNFIVAFPKGNNDIIANAAQGRGGNISIASEGIFGIEERPLNNSTNDINASSEFALDGSVNINTSDINPVQGATELPSNVVEAKQNGDQTCSADREGKATNGLAIAGRGGVHPAPDAPLSSEKINNENPTQASIPQPLETSQGKIQPARGIKVTKSGKTILTAYRTNNAGERIPEIKPNCHQNILQGTSK